MIERRPFAAGAGDPPVALLAAATHKAERAMIEFEADLVANSSSMRRLMRWFILSSCTVFFGVGGWAVAAKVDSAVVTSGTFQLESRRMRRSRSPISIKTATSICSSP